MQRFRLDYKSPEYVSLVELEAAIRERGRNPLPEDLLSENDLKAISGEMLWLTRDKMNHVAFVCFEHAADMLKAWRMKATEDQDPAGDLYGFNDR